jgi:hypothetical protein
MLKWLLVISLFHGTADAQELLTAGGKGASPINQRRASGNACGPASLLNAFQYGNNTWRKAFDQIPGTNSRARIQHVITTWGHHPSSHIKGRMRWNPKEGINLLDLTDMANAMSKPYSKDKIKYEVLTKKTRESRVELLRRGHKLMVKSLKKGLPPIIILNRYAYRTSTQVRDKSWWPVRSHFVVVTEIPEQLRRTDGFYKIKYIDPYGGYIREGHIQIDTGAFHNSPFVIANMPNARVGKSLVKKGEPTTITLSAIIGTW